MQKITKSISPTNGSRSLLASLNMALFCYIAPKVFVRFGREFGTNLRLFFVMAGLVPQVGLGLLMIWLDMPSRSRMRVWRDASTTIGQLVDS